MDYKKFVTHEMKIPFDVERANRKAQDQLRTLFLAASFLAVFLIGICYLSASLPVFLAWVGLTALGLYGLWAFQKRVENTERQRAESKTSLPAEELVLDHNGYHWTRRGPQTDRMEILWRNVKGISFDPLDSFILNAQNQKIKFPRIVTENQAEIMEFIEQNLDLKKTTENKRWRDEEYPAVYYSK